MNPPGFRDETEPGPAVLDRIADLAGRQHGVLTRSQLISAGLTERMVEWRLETGRLRLLHRGVYLLGDLCGALQPARAREMAAVLACGPGAVVSHRSAGWLWDLLPRPGAGMPVEVTVRGRGRPRRPGIRARRSDDLLPNEVTVLDGIPVTTPGRTLRDLSAVIGTRELNRASARAERRGLIGAAELATLAARQRGRPGAPQLRFAIQGEAGLVLTRSGAEERFLDLVRRGRLPPPETNVVVQGHEADFLWRTERLAVEVDGFAFHASRGSFERDRRRDAELAAAGWRVIRVTWRQVIDEPHATLACVAQALARATSVAGRPG